MLYSGDKTFLDSNILANYRLASFARKLYDLPFDLYLTGSRFFGGVSDLSDWDFFCGKLTRDQEADLLNLGFTLEFDIKNDSKVLFGGTQRVFSLTLDDLAKHEFHILEVSNVDFRLKTQKVIKHFFPFGYTDKKHNANSIWAMAESIVTLRLSLTKILFELSLHEEAHSMDIESKMKGGDEADYDEENDWEDSFEWVMESYEAKSIRDNFSQLHSL